MYFLYKTLFHTKPVSYMSPLISGQNAKSPEKLSGLLSHGSLPDFRFFLFLRATSPADMLASGYLTFAFFTRLLSLVPRLCEGIC